MVVSHRLWKVIHIVQRREHGRVRKMAHQYYVAGGDKGDAIRRVREEIGKSGRWNATEVSGGWVPIRLDIA